MRKARHSTTRRGHGPLPSVLEMGPHGDLLNTDAGDAAMHCDLETPHTSGDTGRHRHHKERDLLVALRHMGEITPCLMSVRRGHGWNRVVGVTGT